jgi:hypothetical protein
MRKRIFLMKHQLSPNTCGKSLMLYKQVLFFRLYEHSQVHTFKWLYTHSTPIARSVNQNGLRNFTVLEPRAKRFILFIFDLLFVVLTLYSVAGLKPISAFGSTLASTTVSWDIKLSTQRIINHKHISLSRYSRAYARPC